MLHVATPELSPPPLQAIRGNLGNEELQQMLQEVEAVLDDDAQARDLASLCSDSDGTTWGISKCCPVAAVTRVRGVGVAYM